MADTEKKQFLLGIDLGTTGLKAGLFGTQGTPAALAYRKNPYVDLPEGEREQSAEEWWHGLCSAVRELLACSEIEPRRIAGIGVCGFHHCPVLLTADGAPARSVLLLHDQRLVGAREAMAREGLINAIEGRTRSMVSSAHFPPIVYYLQRREPGLWDRVRWLLLPKDYLRYRLTGEIATEICDATGTNLIEPGAAAWSTELCRLLAVDRRLLPPIGIPRDQAGAVTPAAARETGLEPGTPVVYGGGDSHCALLGLGCVNGGETGMLLGTNSTLRTVFSRFVSHPEIRVWVQHHVTETGYTVSASSMAGASVLTWACENLVPGVGMHGGEAGRGDQDAAYQRAEALASRSPPGSRGLLFLPYLYGERSPFYDPEATGGLWGLRHFHDAGDILRSVFEGVALNIAGCYELVEECAAASTDTLATIHLGGGGSGPALWHQIISDCLDRPIRVMKVREAGSLGAALLAGLNAGIYGDFEEAVSRCVREERVIHPQGDAAALYGEARRKMNGIREGACGWQESSRAKRY